MKTTYLALAAGTALTLSMSAAFADGNSAFLDQDGADNDAFIEQLGSGAKAGKASDAMLQEGDENDLDIIQYSAGTVGTGGNYGHLNRGLDQLGDRNVISISQANGSRVFEIQQDARAVADPAATTNYLNIEQQGNMAVSRVNQTYTGNGTSGSENSVTIKQIGGRYQLSRIGDSNGFSREALHGEDRGVFQNGYANTAQIAQYAAGHVLLRLEQDGSENDFSLYQGGGNGNYMAVGLQSGTGNTASLTFSGNDNGRGGFTSGGDADLAGTASSSLTQLGSDNIVSLTTIGDDNQFGFYQDGAANEAAGTQSGDFNEIAISQIGTANLASFTQSGTGNNAGIVQ